MFGITRFRIGSIKLESFINCLLNCIIVSPFIIFKPYFIWENNIGLNKIIVIS